MNDCIMCGMPFDKETDKCACNQEICYFCCECEDDCACECKQKNESEEEVA